MKYKFLLFMTLILAIPSFCFAEPFKVGVATVNITPPVGYRQAGSFSERFCEGIKDPLMAKAMVFSQGETTGAIIICDLIGVNLETSQNARKLIENNLSIPFSNISIAATHTHTGPLYYGPRRDLFHQAAIDQNKKDIHEKINYAEFLTKQISEVTKAAYKQLEKVNISSGYGFENRIAFNRRFMTKSGKVKTWIGINNPNVVRVAGPVDTEIGLIRFNSINDNQPLLLLSSYALHLDTVNQLVFSADFPFFLNKSLQAKFGSDFTSIFGIGTCGDINHVNTAVKKRNKTNLIGKHLSESVMKALPELEPVPLPSLAIKSALVNATKQEYSKEEIADAKTTMLEMNSPDMPFLKKVKANSIVAIQHYGETIPLEVHAFRLSSETAIVTLPGEVFVELGMQIKQDSPFKTTLVIELANDAPGYIPTKKAFAEGSYETVNSRVVPGSGEIMVKKAIKLLEELHKE